MQRNEITMSLFVLSLRRDAVNEMTNAAALFTLFFLS